MMAQRTLVLLRVRESDRANPCTARYQYPHHKSTEQTYPVDQVAKPVHGDYQGLLPAFGSTCYSSLGWTPNGVRWRLTVGSIAEPRRPYMRETDAPNKYW